MKKLTRLLAAALAVCLLATSVFAAAGAVQKSITYRNIRITLDGEALNPTDANGGAAEPFILDDSVYLPVRAISEALGCKVVWDDETSTVRLLTPERAEAGETLRAGAGLAEMVFPQDYFIRSAGDGSVSYEDGFNGTVHSFQGEKGEIVDNLCTRVLLIEDGVRVAIVALEVAQAPADQVAYTRRIVGEICGVEPENVWVHTTHQFGFMHRPSDPGKAETYDALMKQAAREAAQQAIASFQPALLGVGTGECHVSANKNITAPAEIGGGPYYGPGSTLETDPTMTVLRFEALDGSPIGFFLSYGTKPSALCTTGKAVGNRQVNTEVTGHASKLLEEAFGAPALFCMPAAGDQYPRETAMYYGLDADGHWGVIDIGFDEGIKIVDRLGAEMGRDAVAIAAGIDCTERRAEVSIGATSFTYPNIAGDGEIEITVDAITMGGVAFVGFKQEMDCVTGQQIQAGSPYPTTLLVSFLNGDGKYLGHREAYDFNGGIGTWETKRSAFAVGAAERMVEVADELLTALRGGTYVPGQETKPAAGGGQTGLFSTVEFGGGQWYVLDRKDGRTLLLSEKILETRPYHDAPGAVTWEESSLRAYLNGEWLNALPAADRARVCEVTNANRPNGKYAVSGGAETADRVFLLSLEEAELYLGGFADVLTAKTADGTAFWWFLRSPGEAADVAACVTAGGLIDYHGVADSVETPVGGVRPAMWVTLG